MRDDAQVTGASVSRESPVRGKSQNPSQTAMVIYGSTDIAIRIATSYQAMNRVAAGDPVK